MTFAICQKCGEGKVGALTTCSNCKFRTSNEREVDIALIMSDHYIESYNLKKIGQKIKNGQFIQLEYYFVPLWKKLIWQSLNSAGLKNLANKFLSKVEIKTLKERGKSEF